MSISANCPDARCPMCRDCGASYCDSCAPTVFAVTALWQHAAELEVLVRAAPDYLGARQALHNHWLDMATKAVGALGGDLSVEVSCP